MPCFVRNIKYTGDCIMHLGYISKITCKYYHGIPFLDFYKKTTGETIPEDYFKILQKKHPNIEKISNDRLDYTLKILKKFNITAADACKHLHVFSMNPITMDNYGEILKECGFVAISPQHIIKYHTLVRSRTIAQLKKEGLLSKDLILEKNILDTFENWPATSIKIKNFNESRFSILMVRMNILEQYLSWKLSVSPEEFEKYCKHYLPLKHKPMSDIQEAIRIAQCDIKFDNASIRRNGFIISADPLHTKLLMENVSSLAGIDIRDVIKIEPAILKNNYNSIMQIRDVLEEFRISNDAQQRCLKVYCMRPETVRQRLEEFNNSKEYKILSTNPRVLYMVVHKKKMMNRLEKIETAKKQCYSLNHLVSSKKIFNDYITSFGSKVCGRDIAVLIISSLSNLNTDTKHTELRASLLNNLRRHKYWLHVAINVIHENIQFLRNKFHDQTIFENCQILLYPVQEVEGYISMFLDMRNGEERNEHLLGENNYDSLKYTSLTDDQILSLVVYHIEKKYHFSGNGIWPKQVGKVDMRSL